MNKEEAQANLEKAALDYMIANEEDRDSAGMMLEGFVIQIIARSIDGMSRGYTSNNWTIMEGQPVTSTVGIANILHNNVTNWYNQGLNGIVDDEDE